MLLAIDPGNDTGWALYLAGRLTDCGLGSPRGRVSDVTHVIIECPKLRPHGEKNPNAVLLVVRNAGEWAGRYGAIAHVSYVEPQRWKGSLPKHIHHPRVWAKLDATEQIVADKALKGLAASKHHNVMDAIGLGLFSVGR